MLILTVSSFIQKSIRNINSYWDDRRPFCTFICCAHRTPSQFIIKGLFIVSANNQFGQKPAHRTDGITMTKLSQPVSWENVWKEPSFRWGLHYAFGAVFRKNLTVFTTKTLKSTTPVMRIIISCSLYLKITKSIFPLPRDCFKKLLWYVRDNTALIVCQDHLVLHSSLLSWVTYNFR